MLLKVSAAWSVKIIDCTVNGILSGCHGRCCKGNTFYPSKSNILNGKTVGICKHLGENGCVLENNDKPTKCLLYPFVINNNSLNVHGRALLSICKECYNKGEKPIIETQRDNLSLLFGSQVVAEMIKSVIYGKNFHFRTEPIFDNAFFVEQELESKNIVPVPRSQYWNNNISTEWRLL